MAGWLVYNNDFYDYQFSYPPDVTIETSGVSGFPTEELPDNMTATQYRQQLQETYPDDICVSLMYEAGFVAISAPWEEGGKYAAPCWGTGVGAYDIFPITETLTVDRHPYTAAGYEVRERDEEGTWLYEFLSFSLGDGTSIQYGSLSDSGISREEYLETQETLFQIIASFRSEATSLPIPTPTPTPIPGTVVTAPQITVGDWSPDGRFLTYWTHTADDLEANPQFPQGDFHFYNAVTGQDCSFTDYRTGSTSWKRRHLWLPVPTGDILVFGDEEVLSFQPCGDNFVVHTDQFPEPITRVVAHSTDRSHFLLTSDSRYWLFQFAGLAVQPVVGFAEGFDNGASFSPDGRYVALNGDDGNSYLLDVSTAEATQIAEWQGWQGLGGFAAPEWINDTQFVIHTSRDQGPLLISADSTVQNVGEAFFDQTATADHRALTTYDPNNGEFIVLLHDMEYEGEQPPLQLYYSAANATQSLPIPYPLNQASVDPSFSPSGRWLILYEQNSGESGSSNVLWVRSLASTVASFRRFFESDETIYYRFAPADEQIAIRLGNFVRIASLSASGANQSQGYGPYDIFPYLWSPDGRYLALLGQGSRGEPPALFVLLVGETTP